MAITAKYYGLFFKSLFNKQVDIDTDVIKVMLCSSGYSPDQDTHQYKSSVTNEISGPGYTAGGNVLASVTMNYNTATNKLVIDGADVSWPTSTFTTRYAVVYDSSPGSDSVNPLICYIDFGEDITVTAGVFSISWDATGIASVTVA